jgi:steroid delta-isomerase
MDARKLMANYLAALAAGEPASLTSLFANDAVVISPLYGARTAAAYCAALAADTVAAEVTLLRYFMSPDGVSAAQFLYRWTLVSGDRIDFECIDLFEFAADGRIKKLTMIYDTHPWRGRLAEARQPAVAAGAGRQGGATASPRSGVIPVDAGVTVPGHDLGPAQRHPLAPEDLALSSDAQALLASLPPEECPNELARAYPRIVNAIASHCKNLGELEKYFASLLTLDRKDRQGFPFKVLMELEGLKTFMLRAHQKPDPFWD